LIEDDDEPLLVGKVTVSALRKFLRLRRLPLMEFPRGALT
jgi:hypothetical protein